MPKITQHQLARQLGVSRSTVAAALNPASTIKLNEETRQRIIETAERLNYRPDRYARVMRGGRSGLIGILHFGGLLQVAAERACHAADAVRRENYEVVATDLSWASESVKAACSSLLDARVEGVIVAGMNTPGAVIDLERLRLANIPVVTLSGNPLPWAPHFRGDTRQGIHDLTRHLIGLGHRRLSLLTHISPSPEDRGTYVWASKERRCGFEAGLKEAGGALVADFHSARKTTGPLGIVSPLELPRDAFDPFLPGEEGMRGILQNPVRPTAVLCSNDEIAFGALQACRTAGVAVPKEMALTGYDDIALSKYCDVPFTTVRQPNRAMADAAVRMLLRLIAGEKIAQKERLQLFPCDVILRASSHSKPSPVNEVSQ